MSKTEADDLKKIDINFLKKHGCLKGGISGKLTWTNSHSYEKSHVDIEISLFGEKRLRLRYVQIDQTTGKKKDLKYEIPITNTSCRYGGKREWFICPWYRNDIYCGKRVRVLYKKGDYFACRHCHTLTYSSKNLSGRSKKRGMITSLPELEKGLAEIKRVSYRGKLTKRYVRYLNNEAKFWSSWENELRHLR